MNEAETRAEHIDSALKAVGLGVVVSTCFFIPACPMPSQTP
jgi:hypothetical protein